MFAILLHCYRVVHKDKAYSNKCFLIYVSLFTWVSLSLQSEFLRRRYKHGKLNWMALRNYGVQYSYCMPVFLYRYKYIYTYIIGINFIFVTVFKKFPRYTFVSQSRNWLVSQTTLQNSKCIHYNLNIYYYPS